MAVSMRGFAIFIIVPDVPQTASNLVTQFWQYSTIPDMASSMTSPRSHRKDAQSNRHARSQQIAVLSNLFIATALVTNDPRGGLHTVSVCSI